MRIHDLGSSTCEQATAPLCALAFAAALLVFILPAQAHPHVFVDGGVDFVFDESGKLEALKVTWLYDEFESLYILSSNELSLTANGKLGEEDRQQLIRLRSNWPDDFEGSAHLSVDGAAVQLSRPADFDANLINGQLQMTFTRHLDQPVQLNRSKAELAFYEATYFYAFAVTKNPRLLGAKSSCTANVIPFEADAQDDVLKSALAKLSREETPDIADVGAFFADRITLQCAS